MRGSNGVMSLGDAGSCHLSKEDIFEIGCRATKDVLEEEEVKQGEGGSKYCKYFGLRRVCKPFEPPGSLKLVKGGK
jgi:hypothetical protein